MTPDVLERERPYLVGLAYRMLGSAADAEDVVQDALVKAGAIEDVHTPRAMLTTIVTRLCLDELKSARRRREQYVGPWLPEPVVTGELPDRSERGDDRIDAAESLSMAFLLLLEALTPHERAVFVLREVLDLDFAEIAPAVERSEAACRQLLHRAREHVATGRRRFPRRAEQRELAMRFLGALASGDVSTMVELLVSDAVVIADHGGKAKAILRPIVGADRVARLLRGLSRQGAEMAATVAISWVNGNPAVIGMVGGKIESLFVFDTVIVDGVARVAGVHVVRNPDKLGVTLPALT